MIPRRLLILLCPLALLVPSCERTDHTSDLRSLKTRRIGLVQQLEISRIRQARLEKGLREAREVQVAVEDSACMASRLKQLTGEKETIARDLAGIEEDFAKCHQQARETARMQAMGVEFPVLTTLTGRVFKQVRVLAVSDGGVRITHESGTARLGFADLAESLRERFGMDATLEAAANRRHEEAERTYFREIDRQLTVNASVAASPTNSRISSRSFRYLRQAPAARPSRMIGRLVSLESSLAEQPRRSYRISRNGSYRTRYYSPCCYYGPSTH